MAAFVGEEFVFDSLGRGTIDEVSRMAERDGSVVASVDDE